MTYSEKVLKHFKNPKNLGKIKNASGVGQVGNLACGDVMHLYIKVGKDKKKQEIIEDVKFETFGCAAAIASSSIITEMIKGKTLKEAMKLDKGEIVENLGGLPPIKIHCSVLAIDALAEAIYNYLKKEKKNIPQELQKRHERIEKTKKEMEERYGKWVKKEKEMLE